MSSVEFKKMCKDSPCDSPPGSCTAFNPDDLGDLAVRAEELDDDAAERALRNPVVLQEIFNFLPLDSLLVCSLVNKTWRNYLRIFIRDHRKCTVTLEDDADEPFCIQMSNMDQLIEKMRSPVPFNSLVVQLRQHDDCAGKSLANICHFLYKQITGIEEIPRRLQTTYDNVLNNFKLRSLLVSDFAPNCQACPAVRALLDLFHENRHEIQSLTVDSITFLSLLMKEDLENYYQFSQPQFPKLEEIELPYNIHLWAEASDCLEIIFRNAPNLKRMLGLVEPNTLKVLPTNKLSLINRFMLDINSDEAGEDLEICRKFAEAQPKLKQLFVLKDHGDDPVEPEQFDSLLTQLLQSSHESLERLNFYGTCLLRRLNFIPVMKNLKSLKILAMNPNYSSQEIIADLACINFEKNFPKLSTLEISDEIPHGGDEDLLGPAAQESTKTFPCETVQTLFLNCDLSPGSVLQLGKMFPKVSLLKILTKEESPDQLPYEEIFQVWHGTLEELEVKGNIWGGQVNCDAEFCGLNPEEVEVLWGAGEEFLENFHVVPVRPCVSTMTKLKSLRIRLEAEEQKEGWNDPRKMFLSKVTEILVFERMSNLDVFLSLEYDPP